MKRALRGAILKPNDVEKEFLDRQFSILFKELKDYRVSNDTKKDGIGR
jgi:hypothetical protein